jgi:hypothetical protein
VGVTAFRTGLGFIRAQEPEVVLDPQVVVLASMQQIQIEELLRVGERVVRPHAWKLRCERPAQTDVERRQSLLAVQDRRDGPAAQRTGRRAVGVVALVVVAHEVVEGETTGIALVDLPHEERADGIAPHQAVVQPRDLVARPDELTLNRRQHVLATMDLLQRAGDRDGRLE